MNSGKPGRLATVEVLISLLTCVIADESGSSFAKDPKSLETLSCFDPELSLEHPPAGHSQR